MMCHACRQEILDIRDCMFDTGSPYVLHSKCFWAKVKKDEDGYYVEEEEETDDG